MDDVEPTKEKNQNLMVVANVIIENWVKLANNSLRIGSLLSIVVGYWLLRRYCATGNAPMPQPGAPLAVYVTLVAAACYLAMIWLIGGPLCICAATVVVPELKALAPITAPGNPSWQHFRQFFRRWLLTFLPFLISSSIVCCVWAVATWRVPSLTDGHAIYPGVSFYIIIFVIWIVSFGMGLLVSRLLYLRGTDRFLSHLSNIMRPATLFVSISFHGSILASGWALLTIGSILFFSLGTSILKYDASILNIFWIYAALMIVFFLATSMAVWKQYRGIVVFAVGVIIFVILSSAPRLGGLALRVLGYGGGIPISFVAKTTDEITGRISLRRINGCLVLFTESYITFVKPLDSTVSLKTCHLNPVTPSLEGGNTIPTEIDTIRRDDLLDIFSIGVRLTP